MAIQTNIREAQNLPKTICQSEIGFVFNSSIVPVLNSSAKLFIVIAGIKKRKTQGAKKNNGFKSAKPAFKMLKSSLKINKNKPLINKKTPITKYAIGLAKNELISFFKIDFIDLLCNCFSVNLL